MDPESQKLLEDTFALEQENNKMLRSMKRSMLWARIMSVLYWVLIIGISVGAFYFLQPYVDQVVKTYGSFSNAIKNFQK
ncbi:hypothetical protein HY311_04090 [Candidatus Nomurabacteria bacterium]|nr:hypothetical protein [Candidatus Nomurabacteria bacterium]